MGEQDERARADSAVAPTVGASSDAVPSETFLTVAVSSRALFDLRASDAVYRRDGLDAYRDYQIRHEDEKLAPGEGFAFVRKLLAINHRLGKRRVDVILLSRNSADTGLRVFNSIAEHNLDIVRAAFCSGESPYRYAQPFGCDLFLSIDREDVARAAQNGVAAATLLSSPAAVRYDADQRPTTERLKIAFDGDAVLFAGEADQLYSEKGLEEFAKAEAAAADMPLAGGPFKRFLEGLHRLQREFGEEDCPIRTALVTARGAPAHERVIKTLRSWGIRLDESLFLGGLNKAEFLRAYQADVFFDDLWSNCEATSRHVATGHVPREADITTAASSSGSA